MAMTISEASAVNAVIYWLVGRTDRDPELVTTTDELDESLVVLTRSAHKALGAGFRPEDVPELIDDLLRIQELLGR